jgi:glyoxylase-like metal-dependent hydrolase (beta-lactamase superfamily II)
VRLTFLGTGASGGTPGPGRSQRRESSLLVECGASVMIDVTRDFATQVAGVENIDAVLLTHAHRDAAGGLPALRRWWEERDLPPLPLLASPQAVAVICERHRRLDHVRPLALEPGERVAFEPAVKPVEALAVEPG